MTGVNYVFRPAVLMSPVTRPSLFTFAMGLLVESIAKRDGRRLTRTELGLL
jgi:hypothetical protein